MADESPNLRHLACIQRHGAHFMDYRDRRSAGFVCKHCGLYNVSIKFTEAGLSLWKDSNNQLNISYWKNQQHLGGKNSVTEKEVQHALQLVGYRATNNDPDK